MKTSVNLLRLELNELCLADGRVNDFYWGTVQDAVQKTDVKEFSLACAFYTSGSFETHLTPLNIVIAICDKVYNDDSNINEVESETLRICRDIYKVMNRSGRWQRLGKVRSVNYQFIPPTTNGTCGQQMTVQFALRDDNSICDIPYFDYDFDSNITPSYTCKDGTVIITNSDGDVIETVTVGSGKEETRKIADSQFRVHNSDDSIDETFDILATESGEYDYPDTQITPTDSEGNTLPSVDVASGTPQIVDLPDNTITVTWGSMTEVVTAPALGTINITYPTI